MDSQQNLFDRRRRKRLDANFGEPVLHHLDYSFDDYGHYLIWISDQVVDRLRECRIVEVPAAAAAAAAAAAPLQGIDGVRERQVFLLRWELELPIFGPISYSEKFADSVLSPSEILGCLN